MLPNNLQSIIDKAHATPSLIKELPLNTYITLLFNIAKHCSKNAIAIEMYRPLKDVDTRLQVEFWEATGVLAKEEEY